MIEWEAKPGEDGSVTIYATIRGGGKVYQNRRVCDRYEVAAYIANWHYFLSRIVDMRRQLVEVVW